ncbi:MAG: ATP phosphoribosyltransferase [Candidatus Saccharibacteria bacterium]
MTRETRPLWPEATEDMQNAAELFEQFKRTKTKIAIQKDGELTDVSRAILADVFDIVVPAKDPKDRRLVSVSEDGEYGFVYARNKGICELVANGAVDLAVVGTDRLIEDQAEDRVDIVASYKDAYSWPLVLATPIGSGIETPQQIRRIATQYPVITQRYFETMGIEEIDIIQTVGGTELYPYLDYNGPIDAVVDMSVSGQSLAAHNLTPWTPIIGDVYPVLIQAQK